MRSARKLLLPVLLLLCFVARPGISSAYGGGELVYRWVSDSTYRFFFKLYRDCAGPQRPISVTLCGTNNCNAATNINQTMGLWGGAINGNMPNGTRLNASCAGVPTRCEDVNSTIANYEEWWYAVDVTLHTRCNWRFSVVTSRDASMNLGSGSLYVEATFNNFDFQRNSSPFYSARPVTNICFNKLYGYNNGAVDANADSLVSDIIMPMNAPNCGAIPTLMSFTTASPPYSLTFNPIQTGNTFTFDRNTGHMSFIPFQVGPSAMAVRTREYRGGRLIGSVMRDFNINVANNCNMAAAAPAMAVKTVTGGIYNGGVVYTCQEFQVNLCFDVIAPNPGSILKVSTNINDLFANAVSNYTGQGSDSIRACIQHSATSADSGLHTLVVTVMDSSCLSPGLVNYYRYTIPIMVWGKTYALKYSVLCPGDTAHLYAVNGSAFTWSVLPGGDGISSLSCVNCQAPQATPKITTRYKVTATNTVCPSLYDTVTVNVLDPPIFTPLPDTIICPGDTINLDLKPVPPVGMGYSYIWSPAASLSAGNLAAPDAFPSSDVTYTVVLTNDYSCKAYDTVKVEVLSGIKIHNNDSTICMGQKMQMKATGDSHYTYTWQTDAPNPQINTAGQLNPVVTQADSGRFTYVLRASYPGCPDTTDSVSITTQPYPVIAYNPLLKICKGDSLQLSLSVTPDFPYTFKWWPGKYISDPNVLNPYYYADTLGKLNYRLIATTSAGCSDTADMQIEITSPTAFLKMLSNDTVICPPDTVRLEVGGLGLKSVRWAPGVSLTDTGSFVTYAFPGATTTFYALGIDSNNCADSLGVTILAKPAGELRLPRTVRVYPGETYLVDPEGNCSYFKWNTYQYMSGPAANPLIEPKSNITYIAVATTEFGCEATDTMNVIVEDNSIMDVPNAFTPGWGTLHPKIKAVYRGKVELTKFLIYNRWGNKVFETNDINQGWDGTLNGEPQPMGVYVYYIVAELFDGQKVKQEGNITLIR